MAITTIKKKWYVNGVLTDPTSIVLSDPTGIYGAIRTDTDEVVVVDGTSMEKVSTGVYQYKIDAPGEYEVPYEYWVEVVQDNEVYFFNGTIEGPSYKELGPFPTEERADIGEVTVTEIYYEVTSQDDSKLVVEERERIVYCVEST